MTSQPRVLFLDIETAPILGYVWSLWQQDVGLNQIKSDCFVLSWAAKWLGEDKVIYKDQRKCRDMENDKALMKSLWYLLNKADIIVTHNGKSFDQKRVNARFAIHKFQPPVPYKHIDTKELATRHFGFTSNKLEYLTDKLNVKYKKLKHEKYSGMQLWLECLARNVDAWNEMEKYNKYDVLALEELYNNLIPWDNSINFNLYHNSTVNKCKCGSINFIRKGFSFTAAGKFQRYKCTKCGSWTRGRENLFSKEKRKSLRAKI
jgi:uncharacterized protein YprB with RNaseH-like and TPR domain